MKAVALGARAVLIGRPILWGLTVSGEAGVRHVLELLRAEFALDLLLCGLANWLPWTAPSLSQRNSRSGVESGL